MSDEYLWDRNGPPDPQIEELEQTLGALRYKSRPFEVPAVTQSQRRDFFRNVNLRLAIAAALAIMFLGGVLLVASRRTQNQVPKVAIVNQPNRIEKQEAVAVNSPIGETPSDSSALPQKVAYRNRVNSANARRAAARMRQAEIAKDQLMSALKVASLKLSFAQKKAQDLNQHDQQIRISRKIG
jgi:hypothetical protein